MAADSFESTTWGWQLRQTGQRLREWIDYQLSRPDFDRPDLPSWSLPEALLRGVFWVLVVGLALWLSWLLYRLLTNYAQHRHRLGTASVTRSPSDATTHSADYWWRQANQLAQAGRYPEACRALYLAALQILHDRQQILHDPSRTDGEYLQHLIDQSQTRPYELLIRTHERAAFGDVAPSAEAYQRCQQAYREIQSR